MSDLKWRARRGGELGLWLSTAAIVVSLGACASHAPPPVRTVKASAPAQKLAWMPLDPLDAPTVAQAVNDRMAHVRVTGTASSTKAAVSMEVAQLAIECIQATTACYQAVGHSLGADLLLWAEIDRDAPKGKLRIAVVLFDVTAGTASRQVSTFDDVQAAQAGIAQLVDHAATRSQSP